MKSLSGLRYCIIKKGGYDDLIKFLSGMGGTKKSEIIKAFVYFAKKIGYAFDWSYESDVIKMAAMTGAVVCERFQMERHFIVRHISRWIELLRQARNHGY